MSISIGNNDGVIDSRDVMARIEELGDLVADNEATAEEHDEWESLIRLQDEAACCSQDWEYGSALIRDSYFEEYSRDKARDLNMVNDDLGWPHTCIDWNEAAEQLQADYTEVEFDGVIYWVR